MRPTASPRHSRFISNSPTWPKPTIASGGGVPPNCIPSSLALEGSFRGTFRRMRAAGIDAGQALEVLRKIKVVPVFTAHPTEVARRTVLLKRRRIGKQLERLDRLPLTEADASRFEALIFAEVTSLWQTDEVRLEKPLVTDEIRMGLDHYPFSLFAALPRLYDELVDSLRAVYEIDLQDSEVPDLLFFGSWIGGDRDGNPFVTPGSTREALQRARNVIIGHYIAELERATDQLSASIRQVKSFGRSPRAAGGLQHADGRRICAPVADFELRTLSPPAEPDGGSAAA